MVTSIIPTVSASNDEALVKARAEEVQETIDIVRQALKDVDLKGDIKVFGSFASGLWTGSSDCDLAYIAKDGEEHPPVVVLQKLAIVLPKYGFNQPATLFLATMPVLKILNTRGTDVDISVGNRLGEFNSRMLATYGKLDNRFVHVAGHVKKWAKSFDLVGTSDGHLSSYCYALMVVFFLMHTAPMVFPNLQALADCGPIKIRDCRRGSEKEWDCKFWEDVELIPTSHNTDGVGRLLHGFFSFFTDFDWTRYAVSVRLAAQVKSGSGGGRSGVMNHEMPPRERLIWATQSQWVIEDPFDLEHNLSANCTRISRQRILDYMKEARDHLASTQEKHKHDSAAEQDHRMVKALEDLCATRRPQERDRRFYLRCSLDTRRVRQQDLANHFQTTPVAYIHYPRQGPIVEAVRKEAFLEFCSDAERRRTHTLNETYVNQWMLRLFIVTRHSIEDAKTLGAHFTRIPGSAEPQADMAPKGRGKSRYAYGQQRGYGPFRTDRVDRRTRRAEDAVEMNTQRRRVQDGIQASSNQAELEILAQRAAALGLQDLVEHARSRADSMRAGPGTRRQGSAGDNTAVAGASPLLRGRAAPPIGAPVQLDLDSVVPPAWSPKLRPRADPATPPESRTVFQ